MATFGSQNTTGSNDNWNRLVVQSATPAESGTLQSLSLNISVTGTQTYRLVIYASDGGSGTPGTLLAQSDAFTPSSTGWITKTMSAVGGWNMQLAASTVYWIGYIPAGITNLASHPYQSSGGPVRIRSVTGTPPNPFGTSTTFSNYTFPIYGTYTTFAAGIAVLMGD